MDELSGPPLDRRKFLAALAGASTSVLGRGRHVARAPQVSARATVFFAPPDGRSVLVRFTVDGSAAPAGRLRVFDRQNRQVGTAGVIGFGSRLYGELWLPLDRDTTLSTELELPGQRGVLRTTHRLAPARRWTIYWAAVPDNPIPPVADPEFLDHAELLRLVRAPAPFAIDETGLLSRLATAPMVLAASGLRLVGVRGAPVPLARIDAPDGSAIFAVNLAPGASSRELGLASGRGEMERRIEQWLDGPGGALADEANAVALIASTSAEDQAMAAERASEWNERYAYPKILTAGLDPLLTILDRRTFPPAPPRAPSGTRWQPAARDRRLALARTFEPLARRLGGTGEPLDRLASQFAFRTPTVLVANATPFTMSGVAALPDGSERVVTDVPALGYACVPADAAGRWENVPGGDNDLTLDNARYRIRVDPQAGAIRSLVTSATGREWVRRGAALNAVEGFSLDTLQKETHPQVGTRILARRRSENAVLTTTMTIYHDLPWVDLKNELVSGTEPLACEFSLALDRPNVSWEVPAGFDESPAPVSRLVHLRWLKLTTGADTCLLRGLDAPVAEVLADGTVVSTAPRQARYRLGFASGFSSPEDPWRFGWSAEQFATVAVPGTGLATLPSFGALFVTDQGGACVVDVRQDDRSNDVVVVLQELTGQARDITLGPGVLSFNSARAVDLTGRDLRQLPRMAGGGTAVPLRGFGIAAVRLSGVELARS